jgi:ATP-dependent DNA helicase RecQ
VGDVWEVDARPAQELIPPHVENVVVWQKRRLGPMSDPAVFIEAHMPPRAGGVEVLYDGLLQNTGAGALFIAERSGLPPYSTMFWRPDQPLQRADDGKRIRYRYPAPDGGRTLVFVGFQEPVETIPAGALLRVSLAHWWRPRSDDEIELRCYVQLSGWFLVATPAVRPSAEQPPVSRLTGRRGAPEPLPLAPGWAGQSDPGSATGFGPPRLPAQESTAPAMAGAPDLDAPTPPSPPPAIEPGGTGRQAELAQARRLLKSVFGYDSFRPLQGEIIENLLLGRDTLAVMPTGSGKSLCYQLPALLFGGLTVVVSPLISLMQDQVDQLRQLGAPAAFLNSSLDYPAYRATTEGVRRGEVKLLYTSPETLLRPETLVMLDHCRVDCLAIDEAHCISAWGHDFRPEYRQLLSVRGRYPAAVCVAFTATATARVRQDIEQILGFREENEFIASYNRENLYLEVQPRGDGLAQTLAFLDAHRDQSGIIYCSTRRGVERLAALLAAQGRAALPYHAGMDDATRRQNQRLFARDEAPVMVATIAFGMGINKSNVRFVLHYNLPESIESYYQEIGRAGRDGLRSDCLLLYSRADMQTIYRFIEEGAERERAGRYARLQAMARYAETQECRRVPLLGYFGELPGRPGCAFCDNCLAESEANGHGSASGPPTEVSEAARKLLTCVKLTGQVFGAAHIIDVLRGSKGEGVLRRRHDRLPVYGTGGEYSSAQWKHLVEQFIQQGLLEHDMEHGSLLLTERGRSVLDGEKVFVRAERKRQPVPAASATYEPALFEQLRALRRELADENNVPPYVVFSDRSLAEMASYLPQSSEGLLAIHGVGERKLGQYGERFLSLIRAYCAEHNLQEHPSPAEAERPTAAAGLGSSAEVGDAFASGQSIPELQATYGVRQGTIVNHLYQCVRSGRRFPAARILEASELPEADRRRALAVMEELGTQYLRPIFDALDGAISYDELHLLRLYYLCAGS